jgi:3-oxoacyl-[acyl-carrier-protein] synthase III
MLSILGMGHFHPKTSITNAFLESLNIGTTATWIEEKIGILERATTLPLDYISQFRNEDPREARKVASHTSTDMGVVAAKMACERAGIRLKDIGLVLCNNCNPNTTVPTEAQQIVTALNSSARAFDVMTACPAFALHMDFLNSFEEGKLPDYILCVSTAALTQNVNYNDRSDGAIWGDGAAAWVVSGKKKGKLALLDTHFHADPTRHQAVIVQRHGHFWQDGRAVRDFSVRQTVRLIKRIEGALDIDWSRDIFIGHQANRTMLEQITNNRDIPLSNHWHNVSYLGNQAGAGAPATLSMHWDKIEAGQKIVVAVVGAGLSWGSAVFEVQ